MADVPSLVSRRSFLKWSSGAVALASLGTLGGLSACGRARSEASTSVGVQLYSVRHQLEDDFEGTIATLAEMGFEGVEFADYFGHSAQELRTILDNHGLACCGSHVVMDALQGDALKETVEFNKALGNDYLIIRWLDEERRNTREAFMQTTEAINKIAERLEPHGMQVGYHNHDYIFEEFGGDLLWDLLAEHTREDVVLQLDTGHAAGIGQNPVELLERHPGRTDTLHAKPYSATDEEAVIGEDELDWPNIIETAEEGGTEWHILEYEVEGVPPLEALSACLDNFRQIRG